MWIVERGFNKEIKGYFIGYLVNGNFKKMFFESRKDEACKAVNYLNGGGDTVPQVLR